MPSDAEGLDESHDVQGEIRVDELEEEALDDEAILGLGLWLGEAQNRG